MGSIALAAILYSDPFTYTLDVNGNTLATNQGSFDDAEVFSGRGVELGATNELTVPIANNGGANSFLTIVNGDGTVEQIGNSVDGGSSRQLVTDYDLSLGGVGWNIDASSSYTFDTDRIRVDGSVNQQLSRNTGNSVTPKVGKTYEISVEVLEWTQGTLFWSFGNISWDMASSSIGTTTHTITATTTLPFAMYHIGFIGSFRTTSIKEILPTSTTYDLINQTVLEAMPTTKELTTADLALIEADTSLMTRLALGATDTGLSLVTADVHEHYAFSEEA